MTTTPFRYMRNGEFLAYIDALGGKSPIIDELVARLEYFLLEFGEPVSVSNPNLPSSDEEDEEENVLKMACPVCRASLELKL